jgi:hypothetical protein
MSVMDKLIVLKLNKSWQPVGFATVGKSIVDLCADINSYALDIEYEVIDGVPDFDHPIYMNPVDWDRWITLPVRPWDLIIHTPNMQIRVPTILIARKFNSMPIREFKGRPTRSQIWNRDGGIDQYTGVPLEDDEASLDHVIPASRGGQNTWENLVLANKRLNYKKGNHLNEEIGLKLIRKPCAPKPQPIAALITQPRHRDWKHFLVYNKV